MIQIITGIFLAMHYISVSNLAFILIVMYVWDEFQDIYINLHIVLIYIFKEIYIIAVI